MANYNNLERPVVNESDALVLAFGLTLQQIIDVEWNDANMIWNKSEYGDIVDIRVPPSRLWKPDVLMYNSADEAFDGTYPTNVVVTNTGSCTYIPPGIFKSTCKIDITWFPFDDQDCDMKFGSWTYNGFKVRAVFLQWIPWLLRMSRPGEKITRKTIMMQNKMKELDLKEKSSKSLLANVLDMDDDFRPSSTLPHSHVHPHHPSHAHPPQHNNGGFISLPPPADDSALGTSFPPGVHRELSLILKEIRVITDKIRDDEESSAIENDWKFAAMVLDRLCLITFTLFTFVATAAVLAAAPHVIVM